MHLSRLSGLLAPAAILALFATTLVGVDRLAFRDVSHFYTPLYEYVGERSLQSWLPAWNPLDQTGVPLLGETTTAFFYPVRYLLFASPLSAEAAMGWYVAAHLVLASLAATVAARWAGVRRPWAVVAGIAYSLSGSIVGLTINPPFLVGAAWLPLAAGALLGERPIGRKRARLPHPLPRKAGGEGIGLARSLIAGVAMAMMVLGGDPQTALHTMILAGGVWGVRLVLRVGAAGPRWLARPLGRIGLSRAAGPNLVMLLAAPLLAAALAAPQLAASWSWSQHSERLESHDAGAWWQPPRAGSRRDRVYDFSMPPWHLAGLATPTPWGHLLPQYRRLSVLIPGDGRMWVFSIYPGLLAAMALLCRLANWRRGDIDRWSVIAVLALLLSFGHFAPVWVLQNLTGHFAHLDSALGGAYWLLYHAVPGYDVFRYPAKWLPVFSLAVAITTARWLDGPAWKGGAARSRVYVLLLGLVVVATVVVTLLRLQPSAVAGEQPVRLPVDRFWGPLEIAGGLRQIHGSLLHSLVVLGGIGLVFFGGAVFRCRRTAAPRNVARRKAVWLLAGLLTVDLAVAASGWVHVVRLQREQQLVAAIEPDASPGRWLRTQSGGGWPARWQAGTCERRLMEVEASQRAAWMGRWHLADRQAVLNSMTSIQSHGMASFWQAVARLTGEMSTQQRSGFWRAVKRWLAIDGESHTTDQTRRVRLAERAYHLVDLHRVRGTEPAPRIRLHRQWKIASPSADATAQWTRLLEDVQRDAEFTVPRVMTARPIALPADAPRARLDLQSQFDAQSLSPPAGTVGSPASVRVTARSADRLELVASTDQPVLLSRRVYQDGHWNAWIQRVGSRQWRPAAVHQVDFLAQGIQLPAGRWNVRFQYRPAWLGPSLALAAVCWGGLVAGIVLVRWRRRGV